MMHAPVQSAKDLRRAKSLSQVELSARCAITQATLSRIEAGLQIPRHATLVRMAAILGVTPGALYEACLQASAEAAR